MGEKLFHMDGPDKASSFFSQLWERNQNMQVLEVKVLHIMCK